MKGLNSKMAGKWRREVIFKAISEKTKTLGCPPTILELCEISGLKSTSTVHMHLKRLVDDGLLVQGLMKSYYLSPQSQRLSAFAKIPLSLWVVA